MADLSKRWLHHLALTRALTLAEDIEAAATPLRCTRALARFAFGTVVRTRRLAAAVSCLDDEFGYEARVLVRSLLELYFNYEWIHLKQPEYRANRFLRFHTLEKLTVMSKFPPELRGGDYPNKVRQLERDRAKLRHLFRKKDKHGKLYWENSWAAVNSLENRITQVQAASLAPDKPADPFMYLLYRWFSGVSHGSAQSFAEVLERTSAGMRAKSGDELRTHTSLSAATITTFLVAKRAATDLHASAELFSRVDAAWQFYKASLLGTTKAAVYQRTAGRTGRSGTRFRNRSYGE